MTEVPEPIDAGDLEVCQVVEIGERIYWKQTNGAGKVELQSQLKHYAEDGWHYRIHKKKAVNVKSRGVFVGDDDMLPLMVALAKARSTR